jgi:hypothetical protein
MKRFTYSKARSPALVWAVGIALVIETTAIHALLYRRSPKVAWVVTATSVYTLFWLIREYLAMRAGAVEVSDAGVRLRFGRRFDIPVERSNIDELRRATYKDLPIGGKIDAQKRMNLSKPATPNIWLRLKKPVPVKAWSFPAGERDAFLFYLDDPDGFLEALDDRQSDPSPGSRGQATFQK